MPLKIVRGDITKMQVEAIVNAANVQLKAGGGVCGAIFAEAGAQELQAECDAMGRCEVGEAVLTSGCALPAAYIIHTVGPVWNGGQFGEAQLLHNCYINSLNLAVRSKCRSIAFPLISAGIYGYPKDQAFHIAVTAIKEFLLDHDLEVWLVIFDPNDLFLDEDWIQA